MDTSLNAMNAPNPRSKISPTAQALKDLKTMRSRYVKTRQFLAQEAIQVNQDWRSKVKKIEEDLAVLPSVYYEILLESPGDKPIYKEGPSHPYKSFPKFPEYKAARSHFMGVRTKTLREFILSTMLCTPMDPAPLISWSQAGKRKPISEDDLNNFYGSTESINPQTGKAQILSKETQKAWKSTGEIAGFTHSLVESQDVSPKTLAQAISESISSFKTLAEISRIQKALDVGKPSPELIGRLLKNMNDEVGWSLGFLPPTFGKDLMFNCYNPHYPGSGSPFSGDTPSYSVFSKGKKRSYKTLHEMLHDNLPEKFAENTLENRKIYVDEWVKAFVVFPLLLQKAIYQKEFSEKISKLLYETYMKKTDYDGIPDGIFGNLAQESKDLLEVLKKVSPENSNAWNALDQTLFQRANPTSIKDIGFFQSLENIVEPHKLSKKQAHEKTDPTKQLYLDTMTRTLLIYILNLQLDFQEQTIAYEALEFLKNNILTANDELSAFGLDIQPGYLSPEVLKKYISQKDLDSYNHYNSILEGLSQSFASAQGAGPETIFGIHSAQTNSQKLWDRLGESDFSIGKVFIPSETNPVIIPAGIAKELALENLKTLKNQLKAALNGMENDLRVYGGAISPILRKLLKTHRYQEAIFLAEKILMEQKVN